MKNKTVAELKAYAKEHGIDLNGATKKADILKAIEDAEVIEAEVIEEPEQELAIAFRAGDIQANFASLENKVEEILTQYDGWEPDPENKEEVAQCARERKYLNSLANQLDDRRKAIKQEYLKPLNAFEAQANSIRDRIKEVSGRLKDVENQADQARRDWLEERLKEHYEAYAGLLVDVVPFSKILNEKWLNKSFGEVKAQQEIEAIVDKLASDWDALKSLNLENYQQAEVVFFNTLDLSAAVAYANKLTEDAKKIEAMKQELAPEPIQEPIAEPAPIQEPPAEPIPIQEPQVYNPTDDLDAISNILRMYTPDKIKSAYEAIKIAAVSTGADARPCVMVIDQASVEQMKAIGSFAGFVGCTGTFKQGTPAEISQRRGW